MTKRTGSEIFIQHVERLFADKAPAFYFSGYSRYDESLMYRIINDVLKVIQPNYKSRQFHLSTAFRRVIGLGNLNGDVVKQPNGSVSVEEILNSLSSFGYGGGLATDRHLLVFSADSPEFLVNHGERGSFDLIDQDVYSQLKDKASKVYVKLDLCPIFQADGRNFQYDQCRTDCSVFIYKARGIDMITLFGTKPDEVYCFAYRDDYEPTSISLQFDYDHLEHYRSCGSRPMFFYTGNEVDMNPYLAYGPGFSKGVYYSTPQYIEKYTLLDAASTPFDEVLKLAEQVENGLSVFSNSSANPKTDGIVEEAGGAWREGKYASLSDSIQPGFSRSGTFTYRSAILGGLTVISYNLLLEKEKS